MLKNLAFLSCIYSNSSSVTVLALRTILFFSERFKISSTVNPSSIRRYTFSEFKFAISLVVLFISIIRFKLCSVQSLIIFSSSDCLSTFSSDMLRDVKTYFKPAFTAFSIIFSFFYFPVLIFSSSSFI